MTAIAAPLGMYTDTVRSNIRPAALENQSVTLSGTDAALGSISNLARWGLPIDELVFTKSAGVAAMSVTLCISTLGKVMLSITEASTETLAITMKKGSATLQGNALAMKTADGTYVAASALVQASYILVF